MFCLHILTCVWFAVGSMDGAWAHTENLKELSMLDREGVLWVKFPEKVVDEFFFKITGRWKTPTKIKKGCNLQRKPQNKCLCLMEFLGQVKCDQIYLWLKLAKSPFGVFLLVICIQPTTTNQKSQVGACILLRFTSAAVSQRAETATATTVRINIDTVQSWPCPDCILLEPLSFLVFPLAEVKRYIQMRWRVGTYNKHPVLPVFFGWGFRMMLGWCWVVLKTCEPKNERDMILHCKEKYIQILLPFTVFVMPFLYKMFWTFPCGAPGGRGFHGLTQKPKVGLKQFHHCQLNLRLYFKFWPVKSGWKAGATFGLNASNCQLFVCGSWILYAGGYTQVNWRMASQLAPEKVKNRAPPKLKADQPAIWVILSFACKYIFKELFSKGVQQNRETL